MDDLPTDLPQDCLAAVAAHQRRLQSLRLHFRWHEPQQLPLLLRPFWLSLTQLQALPRLSLSYRRLVLDHSAFRLLCSLPLTHLGLSTLRVDSTAGVESLEEEAKQPPVMRSWEWLQLLTSDVSQPVGTLDALLVDYGAQAQQRSSETVGPAGLRFLSLADSRCSDASALLSPLA